MLVCIPTEPARNEYDFFVHCYLWRQETPFSLALAMFLFFCRNIFTTTKHKMLAIFFQLIGLSFADFTRFCHCAFYFSIVSIWCIDEYRIRTYILVVEIELN